jgi:HAD superfamily phosphoserine phosphatase-like hydrolase
VKRVQKHRFKNHSSEFVASVTSLKPSFAAFDCDGTLWSGDAGEGFFSWELNNGLIAPAMVDLARLRYTDYRAGKVSEDDMCAEMVTMHKGLSETFVQSAANQYFDEILLPQIFPEMQRLVASLREQGCEVWVVSSTNEWMIRGGMRHFGVPAERILAACVEVDNGIITDRLVRVPTGDGKPQALKAVSEQPPDVAFGNSKWDVGMLEFAHHAFAVNPNPDLESVARQRGWRIYYPEF